MRQVIGWLAWVAIVTLALAGCAGDAPPTSTEAMPPAATSSVVSSPTAPPTAAVTASRPVAPTPTLAGATPAEPAATLAPPTSATAEPVQTAPVIVEQGTGPRPTLPPRPADPAGPVTNGDRSRPRIALTFDACQDPDLPAGYDAALIQVLLDTGTPATLFLGGDWMRTHPEETRFLASQPQFELGNHGWAHIDFAASTVEEMLPEIEQTQQIMWELVGRQPRVFRFPGGTYTAEALDVAAALGVRPIEWDVVSGDPDPDITAERMIPWVVNQVENGSIIIMHMNGRGWHTAEALPAVIEQLRAEGYEFVTVSELLDGAASDGG